MHTLSAAPHSCCYDVVPVVFMVANPIYGNSYHLSKPDRHTPEPLLNPCKPPVRQTRNCEAWFWTPGGNFRIAKPRKLARCTPSGSFAWQPGFPMFGLAPRVTSIPSLNLNDRRSPKPFEGSPLVGFPPGPGSPRSEAWPGTLDFSCLAWLPELIRFLI